MSRWTTADIPSQSGRLALITGANSGIGFHAAKELARAGARVILACRDTTKANEAKGRILAELSAASLEVAKLDMASLASIREFAQAFLEQRRPLDLLINNAGVMALPDRRLTADGFELQFGTNHLGHFALTGLLLPALSAASESRIVTVSSIAHRGGKIQFDDLQWSRNYKPWLAYRQSKMANLFFAFELDRRLRTAQKAVASIAIHPGSSKTNLVLAGPGQGKGLSAKILPVIISLIGQSEARGALPTLYGATSPLAQGGKYYGPNALGELRGYPVEVHAEAQAYDGAIAQRLWQISEELTGVRYQF